MDRHVRVIKVLSELIAMPAAEIESGMSRMLRKMSDLAGNGRCWLFQADDQGEFRLCHASNSTESADSADVHGFDDSIGTRIDLCPALKRGETLSLDLGNPGGTTAKLIEFLTLRGVGHCILTPLVEDGRAVGLLCFELKEDRDCPWTSLEFVQEFAGILVSLLARSRAERDNAKTQARLKAILDSLPDLLFEVDSKGCYTGFCVGPKDLMLLEPSDFTGRLVASVLPSEAGAIISEALATLLKDGKAQDVTYALDFPDGRRVFDMRGARMPAISAGEDPTMLFLIRDMTHRVEMQDELRRLSSIIRAMSNLVVIVDTEQRITWVNPAFEKHTGWKSDEIIGAYLPDVVRCDESAPDTVSAVNEALAEGRAFSGQMANKDRHGKVYYVDFNVLPLHGPDGTVQGFVSVETDVTKIREQKIELARLAEAATAAQSRLENALNALPDGIVIYDADERIVICNPAQRKAFPEIKDILVPGMTIREVLTVSMARGLFDRPARPGEAGAEDFIERQLLPYRQPGYTDEFRMKDGRWFRRVNKRTSDGGQICAMIDITARQNQLEALDAANRRLQDALQAQARSEEWLRNIIDSTRVGTWELDLESGIMTASKQWGQIFGLDFTGTTALSHATFLELVHPDDRAMLESSVPNGYAPDPDMFEHEFRMRHSNGQWVWVLSRGRIVVRDEEGEPRQFVGVDFDISEQKRLEIEVRRSDAHLTSALESNVAAFAIYDADDILLYCNSEAERILRLKAGLPFGKRLDGPVWKLEQLDGQPLPPELGPCNRARRAGHMLRDIRFAVRWSDGRRQILTCNATPVVSVDGTSNTVISFWDITDQLQATERLEQALAHAEAMSRSKSIFLANMSHEIRTPLNGVLGLAEVLSMQITNPEHSRMIRTIRQSGETLLAVLNSILDMSKIEAGKMEIEHVPLCLQDILQPIGAVYSIQAEDKGLEFEVAASTGADIPRIGDPHRIQQILHNLLNNAIKFSTEGTVSLTVSCSPGKPVVFEVKDTGLGMTPEQTARVFSSFEQADGSMTRRFGGTGLGLSIVRELVLLMGGTITLESEADQGTTVRVCLPLPMASEWSAKTA